MFLKQDKNSAKYFETWRLHNKPTGTKYFINNVGLGYLNIEDKIFNYINLKTMKLDSWIAVVNDYDLTLTKHLYEEGFRNIVLICTNKQVFSSYVNCFYKVSLLTKSLQLNSVLNYWKKIVYIYEKEVEELVTSKKGKIKLKKSKKYVIEGDSIQDVKFDLIISNPPYAIGNEITDKIIKDVEFKEFVNLMPLDQYRKSDLFKYVYNLRTTENSFKDAAVEHLCIASMQKHPNTLLTTIDFNTFKINNSAPEYAAIYAFAAQHPLKVIGQVFDPSLLEDDKVVLIPARGDFTKSCNSMDFKFNILQDAETIADIKTQLGKNIERFQLEKSTANCNNIFIHVFNNITEKENYLKFVYSSFYKQLNSNWHECYSKCLAGAFNYSKELDYGNLNIETIWEILT